MNIDTLKTQLAHEGFLHIYEWKDDPHTEYPAHAHQGAVSMYILGGGLTFWFEAEEIVLKAGDRFDVPIGRVHTAKIGASGCHFLVGEMIEGDS